MSTDTRPLQRIEPHPMKRPARHRRKAPTWLIVVLSVAVAWLVIMAVAALALDYGNSIDREVASVTKGAERSEATVPAQLTTPPVSSAHAETTTQTVTETSMLPGSVSTVTRSAAGRVVTVQAPGSTVTQTETAPASTVTQTVTVTAPRSTRTVTQTSTVTVCPPVVSC